MSQLSRLPPPGRLPMVQARTMVPFRASSKLLLFVIWCSSLALHTVAQQVAAAAYAPKLSSCPAGTSLVRLTGKYAQSLSRQESAFIREKRERVLPEAWSSYLHNVQRAASRQRVKVPLYVSAILSDHLRSPHLAIATSGGGHRAAIFGAGVMTALDGRNATSANEGTGGLLQASSYLSSLSGGAWLVSSLAQADFPTFPELIFGSSKTGSEGWLTKFDLLQPSSDPQTVLAFIGGLIAELAGKAFAGIPVTFADVWARTLSRHFVHGTTASNFFDPNVTHGAGPTFSGISELPSFVSRRIPLPIVLADSITDLNVGTPVFFNQSEDIIPLTNPIYEFTPYEMGSFDPMLSAFTPTKFLGSPNTSVCMTGFDQVSYIESVSSNLFNEFNTSSDALASSPIGPIISALQVTFPHPGMQLDAAMVPNAFFGVGDGTYPDANHKFLRLVDGGEDGQVLPLQPLLVKARKIDTIIGIDAPADTDENFTAGFSLIASQQRASLFPGVYPFPPVPKTIEEFAAHNLTKRPTFFGCESPSNVPLLIYIANGGAPLGQSPLTNTPTAQTTYQPEQIQAMLNQVHDIATQGIPVRKHGKETKDPLWPVCLACAVVEKQRAKIGARRSGVCRSCLERYCWS
ncbi:lysophospholipase [Cristinia sonorae]|uniref:Lysophospholipase n=1 Tax=Cristinia sonorae TaxID=1940300 RepID=A0A8K0UJJ0_9AGAR|nr:lysophospholipase [Cristinia sonorae]